MGWVELLEEQSGILSDRLKQCVLSYRQKNSNILSLLGNLDFGGETGTVNVGIYLSSM